MAMESEVCLSTFLEFHRKIIAAFSETTEEAGEHKMASASQE